MDEEERQKLKRRILGRVNPLLTDLPEWFQGFRDHQYSAIEQVVDAYDRGVKVVVLDAPTGSGKTLIGETVRRLLDVAALYVCNSKSLQDQFLRDYPYATLLKGRSNYPTELYPHLATAPWQTRTTCEDCTWKRSKPSCQWCSAKNRCPYEVAKSAAVRSPLAVLNTSYLLSEANGPGRFSGRELVIADESDTLESALMGHVSVEISERRMERYNWNPPSHVSKAESWGEWIDATLPEIERELSYLDPDSDDRATTKEYKYLAGLMEKLKFVRSGLEDEYWVYTGGAGEGGRSNQDKSKKVEFKPSRVDKLGKELLWDHGDKWLLMSATVCSVQEMLGSLGWDGDYELVKVPSTFPVENRTVFYVPAADMSRKGQAKGAVESVWKVVEKVLDRHKDDRVLVHTVSYQLTRELGERISGRPVVSYLSAAEREDALSKFLSTPRAVFLAPSMDRGIDLPGDACRVQVIVKVPFPYLGDKQVSARLYSRGGQDWYQVQAIRSIVQMTGRAVRSEVDYATTYILDSQFDSGLWSKARGWFPDWWVKGLNWRAGREMLNG